MRLLRLALEDQEVPVLFAAYSIARLPRLSEGAELQPMIHHVSFVRLVY